MPNQSTAPDAGSIRANWPLHLRSAHARAAVAATMLTLALALWTAGHRTGVFNGADLIATGLSIGAVLTFVSAAIIVRQGEIC